MVQPPAQIAHKRWRKAGLISATVVVLCAVSLFTISRWAFGRDKVAQGLAEATSGEVRFRSFRNLYFPHPGCVLMEITVRRKGSDGGPPLISAAKLTVAGSFSSLLSKHVFLMKAEGLRITPGGAGWPANTNKSGVVIDRLVADNALLQVSYDGHDRPLTFQVRHFAMGNIGGDGPMPFGVELDNPLPPGEIWASGKLGPWKRQQREETPISGSYSFRHADLSAITGIGGLLTSEGQFNGSIRRLHVTGATHTPQFMVTSTHHRFPLSTRFEAEVNATNGDVTLSSVKAKLGDTDISLQGAVMPDPQQHRRSATLDFFVRAGRIQDILYPFVEEPRSPIDGPATCRGRVIFPSGDQPVRQKVALDATFNIEDAHFSSPKTQHKLNKASERARGHPDEDHPGNVIAALKGHVILKHGIAKFSQLSFAVPGAWAAVHGTYNVINERVDLHGTVRLQARISDTAGGFKSLLLKALNPFLKNKNKPQEPLPIAVTGTYAHPQYTILFTKNNRRQHGI